MQFSRSAVTGMGFILTIIASLGLAGCGSTPAASNPEASLSPEQQKQMHPSGPPPGVTRGSHPGGGYPGGGYPGGGYPGFRGYPSSYPGFRGYPSSYPGNH